MQRKGQIGPPIRVIVVDDQRLFADALSLLLARDERIDVVGTAYSGAGAIEAARDCDAEVAVLDVRMTGMDGLEATRRLHDVSPKLRVILLTALDESDVRAQAQAAGAECVLRKSADYEDVATAILEPSLG